MSPRAASWWAEFEARVDATGIPIDGDPFANVFEKLTVDLASNSTLRWQDFEDVMKTLLGDPENRSPVLMDVFTPQGWVTYSFEVVDLEAVPWKELPNLIAFEGPGSFREVVALAKSKYEGRCGYITPTIQRLPRRLIEDLLAQLQEGFPTSLENVTEGRR